MDQDGRRAFIDLIKGCVPLAVRHKHQAEQSALRRYPARVDLRPLLVAMEQRLVRENAALKTLHPAYMKLTSFFYRGTFFKIMARIV
ncbi:hypothetical protein CYMTET_29128 [Cymbomonas tetramitiformis]|uniref:Uncharacterized protein n=1 Tax=Cymbomonas tetramitiformis TaxID=36881 RepID=A0AAE0FLF7_9CHLO|nr:hypothetical protein CYMTET_29128 [Cymbomonas tetramitiformis]